jgi:uncharacterized membrane protein YdjX (TVP38/TMEM64 family)
MSKPSVRWLMLCTIILAIVLVPYFLFGQQIEEWTRVFLESASQQRGWVGAVLSLLLAVDILLPIPSSLVSTACGLFLGILGGTLASWAGMTLSCVAGFYLAHSGRPAVRRLMGEKELGRLQLLSERFGDWAIVICRPVPVLAETSVLFAGMSGMPAGRFMLLSALANLGISVVYATVGAFSATVNSFLLAFAASVLVPLTVMLLTRRARPLPARADEHSSH